MIEFDAVGKTFRDGTAAVVDLNLTVPSDQITVIVGPGGGGKTTTLRLINRMLEPTSGQISTDGIALKTQRKTVLRRQMGYVVGGGGLFLHRRVIDNVGTVPHLLGWNKAKTRKRSIEMLDAVGLDRKLANRFPEHLSAAHQQRVAIARALAANPRVLLMDDPFCAVDPSGRGELHDLVLGLQRELSKTIVLATHDIDEAMKLGDQVAILGPGGRLAQVGTPQHLLDEPADDFVEDFVGRDRGYRALSFVNAGSLSLGRVKAVRDPESARRGEPTLVVDGDARPLGWADSEHPGQLYALGATFDPEHDNLRVALDSALTSPVGLAVALTRDTGRYAGVVAAADILAQVRQSRTAVAETVSVREAESARVRPTEDPPHDESADRSNPLPARRPAAAGATAVATASGDATDAGDNSDARTDDARADDMRADDMRTEDMRTEDMRTDDMRTEEAASDDPGRVAS